MVPGHEIVGIVAKAGKSVRKFKVGDKAAVGCMVDSCRRFSEGRRGTVLRQLRHGVDNAKDKEENVTYDAGVPPPASSCVNGSQGHLLVTHTIPFTRILLLPTARVASAAPAAWFKRRSRRLLWIFRPPEVAKRVSSFERSVNTT